MTTDIEIKIRHQPSSLSSLSWIITFFIAGICAVVALKTHFELWELCNAVNLVYWPLFIVSFLIQTFASAGLSFKVLNGMNLGVSILGIANFSCYIITDIRWLNDEEDMRPAKNAYASLRVFLDLLFLSNCVENVSVSLMNLYSGEQR